MEHSKAFQKLGQKLCFAEQDRRVLKSMISTSGHVLFFSSNVQISVKV